MHTPSARTQDKNEIWRYFYLWILAPGMLPQNPGFDSRGQCPEIKISPDFIRNPCRERADRIETLSDATKEGMKRSEKRGAGGRMM